MRQWRAMLLVDQGFTVSSPMAPPCRTDSVTHNATVAVALEGMAHFPPAEVFDAETANPLLFAMLVSDLADGGAKAEPSPFHIFTRKAFTGGQIRMPFVVPDSQLYMYGKMFPKTYPKHSAAPKHNEGSGLC